MRKIGLWQVGNTGLKKVSAADVELEAHLEQWIEQDPALVQSGLVIVGKQVEVEGGRLDLLGLDPQGRWVIVEIKRGPLRRETIAQVLDYASSVALLPEADLRSKLASYLQRRGLDLDRLLDERDARESLDPAQRELVLSVVGTGGEAGLDRISGFLAERYSMPLSIITFDVFELTDGQKVLAREISEAELTEPPRDRGAVFKPHDVLQLAESEGIGDVFRLFLDTGAELGLYPHAWKTSVMFTPQQNRSRMLFTVWARPVKGKIKAYVGRSVFAEFFPVTERSVAKLLGPEGWRSMTKPEAREFIRGLKELLSAREVDGADAGHGT